MKYDGSTKNPFERVWYPRRSAKVGATHFELRISSIASPHRQRFDPYLRPHWCSTRCSRINKEHMTILSTATTLTSHNMRQMFIAPTGGIIPSNHPSILRWHWLYGIALTTLQILLDYSTIFPCTPGGGYSNRKEAWIWMFENAWLSWEFSSHLLLKVYGPQLQDRGKGCKWPTYTKLSHWGCNKPSLLCNKVTLAPQLCFVYCPVQWPYPFFVFLSSTEHSPEKESACSSQIQTIVTQAIPTTTLE